MRTIRFPAELAALAQGKALVADCATAAGFSPARVIEIELAVEEALTNICAYAYPDGHGEVEVHCTHDETRGLLVDIVDAGIAFDMLTVPPPDVTADPDLRATGGLGVFLLRAMVDDVVYQRHNNHNILRLVCTRR